MVIVNDGHKCSLVRYLDDCPLKVHIYAGGSTYDLPRQRCNPKEVIDANKLADLIFGYRSIKALIYCTHARLVVCLIWTNRDTRYSRTEERQPHSETQTSDSALFDGSGSNFLP